MISGESSNDPPAPEPATFSSSHERAAGLPRKRLFICCDGTWDDAIHCDSPLTNVARLSRCIRTVSEDPKTKNTVLQIVYYQTGIGTGKSRTAFGLIDAAFGRGISINIRDSYSFICNNFQSEYDDIYLVGFSRGAFTVCCLARLIKDIGVLTKLGLAKLPELFRDWEKAMETTKCEETATTSDGTCETSDGTSDELRALQQKVCKLEEGELAAAGDKVQIKAIGIWDAVSAIGFPVPLHFRQPLSKWFRSIHTVIPSNVDHCYHALALDETRKHFQPVIWKSDKCCPPRSRMKQCWFLGNHSDIGGSSENTVRCDLSLIWMITHLKRSGADFDMTSVKSFLSRAGSSSQSVSVDYSNNNMSPRERSVLRALKNSLVDIGYWLMGTYRRQPGKGNGCGELVHWSVPHLLSAGGVKSVLETYVKVNKNHGRAWRLPEDLTTLDNERLEEETLDEEKLKEEREFLELWSGIF